MGGGCFISTWKFKGSDDFLLFRSKAVLTDLAHGGKTTHGVQLLGGLGYFTGKDDKRKERRDLFPYDDDDLFFFWFLYVSIPDARLLEVYITSTLTGKAGEGRFLSSHDGKAKGQWCASREGIMSLCIVGGSTFRTLGSAPPPDDDCFFHICMKEGADQSSTLIFIYIFFRTSSFGGLLRRHVVESLALRCFYLFKGLLALGCVLIHAFHVVVLLLLLRLLLLLLFRLRLRLHLLVVVTNLLVAPLHEPLLFDIWCRMLRVVGAFRSMMRGVELCSVWNGIFSLSPPTSFHIIPSIREPGSKGGFLRTGVFLVLDFSPASDVEERGMGGGLGLQFGGRGIFETPTNRPTHRRVPHTLVLSRGPHFTLVHPSPAPSSPPPPTSPPPPDLARRAETQAQRAGQGRAGRGPGG